MASTTNTNNTHYNDIDFTGDYITTSTGTASVVDYVFSGYVVSGTTRKKMTIKCCECGKKLGSFYGTILPSDSYCDMCHKLDKLKE